MLADYGRELVAVDRCLDAGHVYDYHEGSCRDDVTHRPHVPFAARRAALLSGAGGRLDQNQRACGGARQGGNRAGSAKVTADFMADRIAEMIPRWKKCFDLHALVINADNGPESNGHRTQWLKRLVELSDGNQLTIQLAYYPPYHSKYNPVERLWGVLENHWRGEIIDTTHKASGYTHLCGAGPRATATPRN